VGADGSAAHPVEDSGGNSPVLGVAGWAGVVVDEIDGRGIEGFASEAANCFKCDKLHSTISQAGTGVLPPALWWCPVPGFRFGLGEASGRGASAGGAWGGGGGGAGGAGGGRRARGPGGGAAPQGEVPAEGRARAGAEACGSSLVLTPRCHFPEVWGAYPDL